MLQRDRQLFTPLSLSEFLKGYSLPLTVVKVAVCCRERVVKSWIRQAGDSRRGSGLLQRKDGKGSENATALSGDQPEWPRVVTKFD